MQRTQGESERDRRPSGGKRTRRLPEKKGEVDERDSILGEMVGKLTIYFATRLGLWGALLLTSTLRSPLLKMLAF